MTSSRNDCLALDAADPLAPLRAQFDLPPGVIYLDGNSLGARPIASAKRAQEVITSEWGVGLIRSWNEADWFALPRTLGDALAPIVGAGKGEVVVTDTTSSNLFKVMAAALDAQRVRAPQRKVVVSERSNFPTDLYIVQGLTRLLDDGYSLRLIDSPDELQSALGDDVAVVLLTHVNYRTGAMYDMAARTAEIHASGALAVWDLCHSAGAVPVDLNGANADYAVGCTYKYLNGGPGSPAFVWVNKKHQDTFWQPLSGWWGHRAPFAMTPEYTPDDGIGRYLCGTQPIVSLSLVQCGLDIFAQTSMQALRRKSLALTDLFIELVESRCAEFPLTLVTPRDHAARGSQVSFEHPEGFAVIQALIARGVIGDYREPRIMRFGMTPLYTSFADVWDSVEILRDVLSTGSWDKPEFHRRGAVT
ncbi:kynureninase [Pandoraea faecigallinarum]|uniref:Kynureninase n=1 Tax=Pandoraea faecigallinarum TaxID=656179 RepID=A0A0H3WSP9_9BURK|nr:kynureninase [Pandoraea faecigallinarum]AKM29608.1 kynureninase [Pandoraea faecigallinarum]